LLVDSSMEPAALLALMYKSSLTSSFICNEKSSSMCIAAYWMIDVHWFLPTYASSH